MEINENKCTFDITYLDDAIDKVEKFLYEKNRSRLIYKNKKLKSFDDNNQDFLKSVANKNIVYAIFVDTELVYVGHVKDEGSRGRMRAHFVKKNDKTGSKLKKVKNAVKDEKKIEVSFIQVDPAYMRTSLESALIEKLEPEWNINKF